MHRLSVHSRPRLSGVCREWREAKAIGRPGREDFLGCEDKDLRLRRSVKQWPPITKNAETSRDRVAGSGRGTVSVPLRAYNCNASLEEKRGTREAHSQVPQIS